MYNSFNPFYNGYMPAGFNPSTTPAPIYPNQPTSSQNATQQSTRKNTNKVYVSSIEGARSYPLAPNSELMFCDDTTDIVYDVVVDETGQRTITTLDVKIHEEEPPVDMTKFATKDDIAKLREELLKRYTPSTLGGNK